MNKGAQKVQAIAGSSGESLIFRGRILFCLKDVTADSSTSARKSFESKLANFVQSGENSFSKIFGSSKINVAAFPPLSRKFYKQLQEVCSSQ